MADFIKLQAQHEELLRQERADNNILEHAQAYIDQVRLESRNIYPPKEREQLRANIRYWATYVFSQTEQYPNTELAPFSGEKPRTSIRLWIVLLSGSFLFLLLITIILSVSNRAAEVRVTEAAVIETRNAQTLAENAATAVAATETAAATPTNNPVPDATTISESGNSTSIPTTTTTPTLTPTPTPTSTATPTPTATPKPIPITAFRPITAENIDLLESVFVLAAGHQGPVLDVAFSPDGNWLASSGADGTAKLWNVNNFQSGPIILQIDQTGWTQIVAFNPEVTWLAAGGNDRAVVVWSLDDNDNSLFTQPFAQFPPNEGYIFGLDFSPNGNQLAVGSGDGRLTIWNVESGNVAVSSKLSESAILELEFNPAGTLLAVANLNGGFRLLTYPALEAQCLSRNDSVLATSFSSSGDVLVFGNKEGELVLMNPNSCGVQTRIPAHEDYINGVAIGGPNDDIIVSVSRDGSVFVMPGEVRLEDHLGSVESVAINPEGNLIASASIDGTIILWGIPEE